MLNEVIGNFLPAAVAVALSPVPIIAVILMLSTPKARTDGPAFALGWIVGLSAVTVVVATLAGGADSSSSTNDAVGWIQVALGVLFLWMAHGQWRKRPRPGEVPSMPAWMATIDGFTPIKSLGIGVLLSGVNPKNLALSLSAGVAIAQAGLSTSDAAIAIAVFVAIGSITVVGSVLFALVAPRAASKPLATMKEFMSTHNVVIMMIILVVLGAKLIGDGLSTLG